MSPSLPARRGVPGDVVAVASTEWVTIRNPHSGNTARVPRSALPQMPKWREVGPGLVGEHGPELVDLPDGAAVVKPKKSRKKTDDAVSAAEPEES